MLIAAGQIIGIAAPGTFAGAPALDSVVDGRGLIAFPGLIDQHVHITGGGGEEGFASKIPELPARSLYSSGITTVVGLLGADGTTRGMENLYAKAKALEAEGLTTYIYAGSYGLPPVTLTGSLRRDIVFIDKVLGAGEIALSDHRSSNPDARALIRLASEVHLGGMLSGKAGVVHLHIGDGKAGLRPLTDCLAQSDLPPDMFVPTHINRNPVLFRQGVDYCRTGGNIDLTAGETAGLPVPDAVRELKNTLQELSRVTVSSDAGGSGAATGDGVAPPGALYADFCEIIRQNVLPPNEAVALFTENVARRLKLYPKKGVLQPGSDADILLTDQNYQIRMVYAQGRPLLDQQTQ